MTSRSPLLHWLAKPAQAFFADKQALITDGPTVAAAHQAADAGAESPCPTLGDVFTPTQPRSGRRALVGRRPELERILAAMNDEAAHVVIYAERGRGKTSLTNLIVGNLRESGATIGRYVCHAESDFSQIMHGLAADLPASLLGAEAPADARSGAWGCDAVLPATDVLPADVAAIPARLACRRLIFVVDEFDRVQDSVTRTKLADTIKLLSDRGIKLLFLVVGVSDTLDRIIGQHPSIQRSVVSVHLPLLDDAEVCTMLTAGGHTAGIAFTDDASEIVVRVARGMPYMAQLMGLRIAQQARARGAAETSLADVRAAIERLIEEDLADAGARHDALVASTAGPLGAALALIIQARQDRWGRSSAESLTPEMRAPLLRAKIFEASTSLPGMLLPLDRPLIYHLLLRDALAKLSPAEPGRVAAAREKDAVHGD